MKLLITATAVASLCAGPGLAANSNKQLGKVHFETSCTPAAQKLFGSADPVGYSLRIGRHRFEVVGLLSPKGQSPFGADQDDRLVMPIGSWHSRVFPGHERKVDIIIASAPVRVAHCNASASE